MDPVPPRPSLKEVVVVGVVVLTVLLALTLLILVAPSVGEAASCGGD